MERPNSDELMHYGVLGMKWGHRKARSNSPIKTATSKIGKSVNKTINKQREKQNKRRESYNKTQRYFGPGGVLLRSTTEYAAKKSMKGLMAKTINSATNAYIMTNGSKNYTVSRGADFLRRAAITGLSLSAAADKIQMYADIGRMALNNK